VKIGTMSAAALLLAKKRLWATFPTSLELKKFIQPLRLFGTDIPLAATAGQPYKGVDYYEIAMRQFEDQLHPDLEPTTLRGYTTRAAGAQKHLEGAILATVKKPVRVKYKNELPSVIPLPVDLSLVQPYAFSQTLGDDRAAPHLHGGLVPWPSDGGPFHWFNNPANGGSIKGPSVINWLPDGTGNLTDDYWYPNQQSARFMWYHDHAVGLTRLNPYLGLASGYILTDSSEGLLPAAGRTLMKMLGIPEGDLTRQVHLVVQDKIFRPSIYSTSASSGSLWYPDTYDSDFFDREPGDPLPVPSTGPEFWGDTMLMNGTVYPYMDVEPRRYRFRILNACNTRVLSLRLVGALGVSFPDNAEPDLTKPGPAMTLIGTEGGFLDGTLAPKGVVYNNTAAMPLVLAPAERADIIVDFGSLAGDASNVNPPCFILHNDAPVPFPGGTPLADFFPGSPDNPASGLPGFGPNTRTLLQFRLRPLGALTGNMRPDPAPNRGWILPPSPIPAAPTLAVQRTRDVALYETVDQYGRLAQNLGTLPLPMAQLDPPTEIVQAGTREIWRVFNNSADTHPIHFHFFNVRVLSRQPIDWNDGAPIFTGPPLPGDPSELGWKETVKFNPDECTTLFVELPETKKLAPDGVTIPNSPRLEAYQTPGAEYVWHCHILEHEEHDMMRPLVVQG